MPRESFDSIVMSYKEALHHDYLDALAYAATGFLRMSDRPLRGIKSDLIIVDDMEEVIDVTATPVVKELEYKEEEMNEELKRLIEELVTKAFHRGVCFDHEQYNSIEPVPNTPDEYHMTNPSAEEYLDATLLEIKRYIRSALDDLQAKTRSNITSSRS